MKQKLITLIIVILIIGFSPINGLTIPPTINYQGNLQTHEKIPINDTLKLTFRLYATTSDDDVLWSETHESVSIENGIFNVELGQTESLYQVIQKVPLYLGITVDSDEEMSPRTKLNSWVYEAQIAKSVPDDTITTEKLADGAVTPEKVSDSIPVIQDGNLSVNAGIVIDGAINIMERLSENSPPVNIAQIIAKPDRIAENSENSIVNKVLFYLKSDESDGTKLSDLAHKHDATAYNNPLIVQGKTGYARQFDATKKQTIQMKDHGDFNFGTNSFSIAFWMKAPAPEIWTVIMSKANCVNNSKSCYGWFFGNLDGTSKSDLVFTINSGGTEDLNNKSVQASNIFDNNWHHIVGAKDGNTIYLYVDGQKRGTTANVSQSVSVEDDIVVGAIGDAYPYSGAIDEIIAWNRAISDTEVAELFSSDGLPIDEGGVFVRRKDEVISLKASPWKKNGNNVSLLEDNLGIGTDHPRGKLDVKGKIYIGEGYSPSGGPTTVKFHGTDSALIIPTFTESESSDLRIYIEDNPNDRLSIWGNSCVGGGCMDLNKSSLAHYFEAGGNAYHKGDVSAASFTDRTPYPEDLKTAYDAVMSMQRLPDNQYDKNDKQNQLDHSKLHAFLVAGDGVHRDLSATVSAQNEVIKNLIKEVQALKTEIENLKNE